MRISASSKDLLSHPKEAQKHLLVDHLESVGSRARYLYGRSKFNNPDVPFYAGLLHDIGKINPLYQEIFHADPDSRKDVKLAMEKDLERIHSPLSARAARHLLSKAVKQEQRDAIVSMISGHHTQVRSEPGELSIKRDKSKLKYTVRRTAEALPGLREQVGERSAFRHLDWNRCENKFGKVQLNFNLTETTETWTDSFLDISFAFSCLLQADRGSFQEWKIPRFNIKMNTDKLTKDGKLASLRTAFQRHASKSFNPDARISVLKAPTGIGKTKALLDMAGRFARKKVERVFYFSPLLALTEDVESKIREVILKDRWDDVLVYTHLFAGLLQDRASDYTRDEWVFANESFNKPLVIATTQRLLMTLYSNSARDKLKMASFANSVLIIDEIQTVPKPVLTHLVNLFKAMSYNMNTRFVLVSATIPHELGSLKRIEVPGSLNHEYLEATRKSICVEDSFDPASLPTGKVLVMANTRSKAARMFGLVKSHNPSRTILYLSSGIRKHDRREIISELSKTNDCILVATQVVEAGVDLSFSRIYREMAPLDNIVQAMGRLNRHGEANDALMVVYENDGDNTPYSKLEFEVSARIMREVGDSVELDRRLNDYYKEVSKKNLTDNNIALDLERLANANNFEEVWEMVRKRAILRHDDNTVYIPDKDEYDKARVDLTNKEMKKWADITASLPVDASRLKEMFDEKLYDDNNVLLPKLDMLDKIYDSDLGLDTWNL